MGQTQSHKNLLESHHSISSSVSQINDMLQTQKKMLSRSPPLPDFQQAAMEIERTLMKLTAESSRGVGRIAKAIAESEYYDIANTVMGAVSLFIVVGTLIYNSTKIDNIDKTNLATHNSVTTIQSTLHRQTVMMQQQQVQQAQQLQHMQMQLKQQQQQQKDKNQNQ